MLTIQTNVICCDHNLSLKIKYKISLNFKIKTDRTFGTRKQQKLFPIMDFTFSTDKKENFKTKN